MKKTLITALTILTLLLPLPLLAEEEAEPSWSDEAELSYVSTGGNSDTQTFAAKNLLKNKYSENFSSQWKVGMLETRTDDKRTAESYMTELRGDYKLSKKSYFAVIGGWLRDEFAGIENRYYMGPALGYSLLTGPKHFLKSEAGVDYVKEEYIDESENDFLRGRIFAEYKYHFSNKNKFLQSAEYLRDLGDSENYNVNTETALIAALNGNLSLKTSYLVKYDNAPVPETLKRTDTIFTVTLVVNIN